MKFQFQDPHVYWKAARPMCSHIAHGCFPATPAELADGAQGAPKAEKVQKKLADPSLDSFKGDPRSCHYAQVLMDPDCL